MQTNTALETLKIKLNSIGRQQSICNDTFIGFVCMFNALKDLTIESANLS